MIQDSAYALNACAEVYANLCYSGAGTGTPCGFPLRNSYNQSTQMIRAAFFAAFFDAALALLILLLPATLHAKAALRPLSSYNWAVNASPNLATKPPPKAAVRKLMEELESDFGEDNDQTRICSFRFVDLGHDGNLTLLVSRYDGGRGGCGEVYMVDRTADGFQQHDASTAPYGIDDVNQVLQEIDGKFYIVLDLDFAEYDGADRCAAGYMRIYAWDGSNYSNQSALPRFKKFYEHEIATMRKGVAGVNPECDKASIAKIQRDLLGAPPNTGLDDAIGLAKSSDPHWREFAGGVLADIGTPEAKSYLRALMNDPDKEVADGAKGAFAFGHFEKKPPPQKDFLPLLVDDTLQTSNEPPVGPWLWILPPRYVTGVDLKADYSKWWQRAGFDSQEQCEYGAQVLRKMYRGDEPYRYGKCIPAEVLQKSAAPK